MKISLAIAAGVLIGFGGTILAADEAMQREVQSSSSPIVRDICNLDLIYNKSDGYEYSLPRSVLEGFLSGKAFDHPIHYSEAEFSQLRLDINELFQSILSQKPVRENLAVITAGAPGAGKTIKLRQDLEENRRCGKNYAYLCPDDVCLKNQTRTYVADLQNTDGSKESRRMAYDKWRPGSNAAVHLILANLIREKYAFYFGSTSSGPGTGKFFEFIKKQGYRIRLIYIVASDDVRWESIRQRENVFIQATENDVKEKGFLLPQRINDTFLAYADEIEFYYRSGVHEDAKLAAKWLRNAEDSEMGILEVIALPEYEQLKAIHNAAADVLKRPDLRWEASVEKRSTFIH